MTVGFVEEEESPFEVTVPSKGILKNTDCGKEGVEKGTHKRGMNKEEGTRTNTRSQKRK